MSAASPRNWFVGHVWTLAYEEQFYIVVGLLLLFARRHFFLVAGVFTIVEILLRKSLSILGLAPHIKGFFFDGQWEMFAAGMLVYYLLNYSEKIWQRAAIYSTILAMFALNLAGDKLRFSFATAAWAFAFLMAVLQPWEAKFASMRMTKPLVVCGTMCYSLYLVHWPITQAICHAFAQSGITSPWMSLLVVLPVCLALSMAVGWLFYLAVERRYLNSAPTGVASSTAEKVVERVPAKA